MGVSESGRPARGALAFLQEDAPAEDVVTEAKGQYTYTTANVYLDPNNTCENCE